MADILDNMTEEEIREQCEISARLARHAANALMAQPENYDLQGDFVFWLGALTRDRSGNVEKTLDNLCTVLETDARLAGLGYDLFNQCWAVTEPVPWRSHPGPWRDADQAQLMRYIDNRYCHFPLNLYAPALATLQDKRAFHPIHMYLGGMKNGTASHGWRPC